MIAAAAAIAFAWLVLLSTAYVVRYRMGARVGSSAAAIGACYLALVLGALLFLGPNRQGVLGAAGMLVPTAVAGALVALPRG